MLALILSGIDPNVVEIMLSKWRHFKSQEDTSLFFPSLITQLCKREKVEEYVADTCVNPGPHIFPLQIQGEDAPCQSKNRKVDLGKSTTKSQSHADHPLWGP